MSEVEPGTLLEWLEGAEGGDDREMQLIALEQLCMLLLMSDNVDRCFERCPPRSFLPALCRIILDEQAPDNVLEVTARALTYYLDVSAECTRRIVMIDGAVKAVCNRLVVSELESRTGKDLAEQCVKVLEYICLREAGVVFEAGGLNCIVGFIQNNASVLHNDTLQSAITVVLRLCAKIETNDTEISAYIHILSALLKHENIYVSDGALRCFASLADRFARKNIDLIVLVQDGLLEELIERLSMASLTTYHVQGTSISVPHTSNDAKQISATAQAVISLISTLCRGSAQVTYSLLRSKFPDSIENAMRGDERCVLDTLRLFDLILLLIFEDREILSSPIYCNQQLLQRLRRIDAFNERSHRQLVDFIRMKDTDAFIDAIESGNIDVNALDEVGQSLLNWASAFGTVEMVEYLCSSGADVNKGLRSSSLHYAACFGRPDFIKILLRNGANLELRDEDGKTALDKARERSDEGHREVLEILQSPRSYLLNTQGSSNGDQSLMVVEKREPKGDPEMAPIYLKRFLPIFCLTFQNSMLPLVRKYCLSFIKKMIVYIQPDLLKELYSSSSTSCNYYTTILVEIINFTLDNESSYSWPITESIEAPIILKRLQDKYIVLAEDKLENEDGHVIALILIQELMIKAKDIFLDQFQRFGIISKIEALAIEKFDDDLDNELHTQYEFGFEFQESKLYHWNYWSLCRYDDLLYMWLENNTVCVQLLNTSNGWFQYLIDDKLSTMYSSGLPELMSDTCNDYVEFTDKLKNVQEIVKSCPSSITLFPKIPGNAIMFGNWIFSCNEINYVSVRNRELGDQYITLKDNLAGLTCETERRYFHLITSRAAMAKEIPENNVALNKSKVKNDLLRYRVRNLAREIFAKFFKESDFQPRSNLVTLNTIISNFEKCLDPELSDIDFKIILKLALKSLIDLLKDEDSITAYELCSSGLVNILLKLFSFSNQSNEITKRNEKIEILEECLLQMNVNNLMLFIKKLIMVLENLEKLPIYLYDNQSSSFSFHILNHRMTLKLEMDETETELINRTGQNLKVEPICNIENLERFLLRMVAKQWYDYDRSTFLFLSKLKDNKYQTFSYHHDFDENGLIYFIGTNGKTYCEWINPSLYGIIYITSSDGKNLPYGKVHDILSRETLALNCHTSDNRRALFAIDLGVYLIPSHYTLRHARGYGRSALRNWLFQMSRDGRSWMTLYTHHGDLSLNEPGSTHTWAINTSEEEVEGWRYVRIQQMGRNSSGQTSYLSLSGFEIYGKVTSVVEDMSTSYVTDFEISMINKLKKLKYHTSSQSLEVGARVVPGPDFNWNENQNVTGEGTVLAKDVVGGWVQVFWDNGVHNSYRMGAENKFDLRLSSNSVENPNIDVSKIPPIPSSNLKLIPKPPLVPTCSKIVVKDHTVPSGFANRKSISTRSLPEATTSTNTISVASTEQSTSADNLVVMENMESNTESKVANKDNLTNPTSSKNTQMHNMAIIDYVNIPSTSTGATQTENERSKMKRSDYHPIYDCGSCSYCKKTKYDMISDCEDLSSSDATEKDNEMISSFDTTQRYNNIMLETGENSNNVSLSEVAGDNNVTVLDSVISSNDVRNQEQNIPSPSSNVTNALSRQENNYNDLSILLDSTEIGDRIDLESVNRQTDNTNVEHSENTNKNEINNEMVIIKVNENVASTSLSISVPDLSEGGDIEMAEDADDDADDDNDDDNGQRTLSESAMNIAIDSVAQNSNPKRRSKALTIVSTKFKTKDQMRIESASSSGQGPSRIVTDTIQLSSEQSFPSLSSDGHSINSYISENDTNRSGRSTFNSNVVDADGSQRLWESFMNMYREHFLSNELNEANAEDSDEENEHENEDDQDFEVVIAKNCYKSPESPASMLRQRSWSSDFVLKRQFLALIPAFDPRPGRSNVNQTTDIDIPVPMNDENVIESLGNKVPVQETRLKFFVRGPGITGVPNVEIEVTDLTWTLFKIAHDIQVRTEVGTKSEKMKRVWDSVYTLIYRQMRDEDNKKSSLQNTEISDTLQDILSLLKNLFNICLRKCEEDVKNELIEQFVSKKLTNKLLQQIQDTLMLSSASLPQWTTILNENYPFLFPLETRQVFLNATAFGISRTIVWLQTQRESALQQRQLRLTFPPFSDDLDLRIGRLKHERVKVPRDKNVLLKWAMQVMKLHANSRAILEVEFVDEEGTGLGPTLEFYALVALELQRKDLAIWLCGDSAEYENENLDYYVHLENGLFPAPLPQNSKVCDNAEKMFWFLGVFIAKAFQDNRLVDMPLSNCFLKLLCNAKLCNANDRKFSFQDILTIDDFLQIDPIRAKFLKKLQELYVEKQNILAHEMLSDLAKNALIRTIKYSQGDFSIKIEDLALSFVYQPSSKVFGYDFYELIENGSNIVVDLDNMNEYVNEVLDYCLNRGIVRQMDAFSKGFSIVLPMEKLNAFLEHELKLMICGERYPHWTLEDIYNYTEPKLGYNKDSAGFKRFANVLVGMNGEERKAFLQFVTGCSSLPPGGLANLHPRLTIVRKIDALEGSFPSVNTCVHYLKLPDYPTEEMMRDRILTATKEHGFHLN